MGLHYRKNLKNFSIFFKAITEVNIAEVNGVSSPF